jgi:hypothetical protein
MFSLPKKTSAMGLPVIAQIAYRMRESVIRTKVILYRPGILSSASRFFRDFSG